MMSSRTIYILTFRLKLLFVSTYHYANVSLSTKEFSFTETIGNSCEGANHVIFLTSTVIRDLKQVM